MKLATQPSSDQLARYVQAIWCYAGNSKHQFESVLPTTKGQLLINLHGPHLRHWSSPGVARNTTGPVALQGILTQPALIDTDQKREVCGVQFSPFGLSAFTNLSANGFTDTIVDADEVWGNASATLRRKLQSTTDMQNRLETIEAFLLKRLIVRTDEDVALEEWLNALHRGVRVHAFRDSVGLSQRKLHELFDRRIGVRPKLLERIGRFSGTLEGVAGGVTKSELASDLLYSDQAHMSREFRHFSGTSPVRHTAVGNEIAHAHIAPDKIFKTRGSD